MSFFEKSRNQKLAMFSSIGKGSSMFESKDKESEELLDNVDDTQPEAGGDTDTEEDTVVEETNSDDLTTDDDTLLESVCPSQMLNLSIPMAEDEAMLEAAEALSQQTNRSDAMAAVQVWANESNGDLDDLESLPYGLANVEGEGDMSDDDIERFEEASTFMGEALIALGANEDDIFEAMINGSQSAADNLMEAVTSAMDSSAKSEDEIISSFGVADGAMYEQRKMVVRDGKKKWIKVPKRKKRMNAKQKASLRKARKKAHTGSAKRKRNRSVARRG